MPLSPVAALRNIAAAVLLLSMLPAMARADNSVTVFAAASTAPAMREIADLYKREGRGELRAVFASSGTLARQIDNGAPADLFLSANAEWMAWLKKRGRIDGDPVNLLANRLVLIQPADAKSTLTLDSGLPAQLGNDKLAIGDPAHVPAGIYAKQALEKLGLWDRLAPSTVRMKDVRAALFLVARGEVAAGIVYESDLVGTDGVRLAAPFPDDSHEPIRYPAGVVADGNTAGARGLLDFLKGPAAAAIFRRHGFRLR